MGRYLGWAAASAAVLVLAGCDAVVTPQAQARVDAAAPGSPADEAVKPIFSHPLIDQEGNAHPCTVYPGGGAAGACEQR